MISLKPHICLPLLLQLFFLDIVFGRTLCNFSDSEDRKIHIPFDEKEFECKYCREDYVTLVTKKNPSPCSRRCNGLRCYDKSKCLAVDDVVERLKKTKLDQVTLKLCSSIVETPSISFPEERDEKSRNHIPLIIGFAVGGIMLAVVIAGVLLGRANRALSPNDSSIVTTPVSMSYSEWVSNYTTGGWGAKNLNNRVQESAGSLSDIDGSQGLAVYSLVYGDTNSLSSEKQPISDDERTVIEVDELGLYGHGNKIMSYYQPQNDVLSCVATPMKDDANMMTMEWQNEFRPYETFVQLRKEGGWNSDAGSYYQCSTRDSAQFDRDCWSAVESIRRDSFATTSIYSKRRDTWSDESTVDPRELDSRFFFHRRHVSGDRLSSRSAWVRIPRQLSINLGNLRQVFVDVHRSMSYSFDDACTHGYWAPSDGSGMFDEISVFDNNEKTNSYITIKNHYICYGSNTIPRLQDQVFVYSLQRSPSVGHRRCSI